MPIGGPPAIAIFRTTGMDISGRARKLRLEVGKLDGILVVDFNYVMDSVSIRYDSEKLTLAEIRKAIDRSSA
jgi:copper chaperone CopZ